MKKTKTKKSFFHFITSSKCVHQRNARMMFVVLWIGLWSWWIHCGVSQTLNYVQAEEIPVLVVNTTRPPKEYAYNERVPEDVVKQEIVKIARRFKVSEQKMLRIAKCESGYNNLAASKTSSALGVYQFINQTWEATDSWKVLHKSPTDYKANVWEAGLALSRGEDWKWEASKGCWK